MRAKTLLFLLVIGLSIVACITAVLNYHRFLLLSASSSILEQQQGSFFGAPKHGLYSREGSFSLTVFNDTYTYRYSKHLDFNDNNKKKTPSILFGILSTPENKIARDAIRQTWGKNEHLVFIVAGSSPSLLYQEMNYHPDILFLEANEDYRSGLTRKTMLALHFMDHLCSSSRNVVCLDYLFKTDDDSYINTTQLRLELRRPDPKTLQNIEYYGEPSVKTEPNRNQSSRFYISTEEYPARYYPNYAFGMGYAVSNKLASCAASKEMQKVRKQPPWEDVATGVFARKCNVKLTQANWMLPGMKSAKEVQFFPYEILQNGGIQVTVVHGVKKPEWMFAIHKQEPL